MSELPSAEILATGETVTSEVARELTDRIRAHVETAWELIQQAYLTRAWAALGYDSWDEYCAQEFDRARIRVPREERAEVVASLREIGMSTRAIAVATGVSDYTVRQDLAGARNLAPDPYAPVTGRDGKSYPPKPLAAQQSSSGAAGRAASDEFPFGSGPAEADAGQAQAATRKRSPITESFDEARRELLQDTKRLQRLVDDDRFDRYATQLAQQHRADLTRARDALQAVIDRLPHTTPSEG
ncbi:hypothetical protein [Nocardia goodfellowii]|uniref:Transposase-like protein n=1 Tax=Nocardia goodfellowii TaxID=882446 RepID=A0ABS4QPG3_9NOCA|nr:hypothetical protein [Nocardia goodfellowii]MBP2193590.1 transposase-like protein [Nocardia goodfellowii]